MVIARTGGYTAGAGVLINPNSFYYLIEYVQEICSNGDIYQLLAEKAAYYAYHIITRHVFVDGNKRTGMISAILFLRLNGQIISASLNEEGIVQTAESIENKSLSLSELADWFLKVVSPK